LYKGEHGFVGHEMILDLVSSSRKPEYRMDIANGFSIRLPVTYGFFPCAWYADGRAY
jgi:hypothetical protein